MVLTSLLERAAIGPDAIDFVISCGEEATGDRYQRGGGGLAKAIGEMCGCVNASGMDIKNFLRRAGLGADHGRGARESWSIRAGRDRRRRVARETRHEVASLY